jgi:cytochrome c oxidase cbb3-type subunit 3/ubiquinol-cytochrome c reductase cytochrome c subunit
VNRLRQLTGPLGLLLSALLAGCDPPGKPNPADQPLPADQVSDFDTLYRMNCSGCHGADGKRGPAPPLNDPLFLAIVPDAVLWQVIREGRAVSPEQRSPMPAFFFGKEGPPTSVETQAERWAVPRQQSRLTAAQVRRLADGIKARWGGPPPKEKPPPYLAPKEHGDKKRGEEIFDLACSACHGDNGQGAKQAGAINDRAFLALISDQELRRIIITGRSDLGMPNYSDRDWRSPKFKPLTSEQINDLVALLASWRQGGSVNDKGGTPR